MLLVGFFHFLNLIRYKLTVKRPFDYLRDKFKIKPQVDDGANTIYVQLAETIRSSHSDFCYYIDSFMTINPRFKAQFMTQEDQDELCALSEEYLDYLVNVSAKLTEKNKELKLKFENQKKVN